MKDVSEIKATIEKLTEDLKRERDEIHLKLHLGKEDLETEWAELEKKFHLLETKAKSVQGAATEASKDIFSAAKLLGDELKNGYKKVRNKL
ncbi:MAG: hypothetical protein JKY01_07400 [Pseudomonadales bacterium]|nr:hypothetical protein [Pseudomonadales bacterium]